MGVLGIITCEIMELELAHILASDPELKRITIIENARSERLIKLLQSKCVKSLCEIPHVHSFTPDYNSGFEVIVRALEFELHKSPGELNRRRRSVAWELSRFSDALLMCYGLCGSFSNDPKELIDVKIPVVFPSCKDKPVVNCISMFMGGFDSYSTEQRKIAGTLFMTPGWVYHWKRMFSNGESKKYGVTFKNLFSKYKRILLIITPVMGEEEMRQNVEELAIELGLRVEAVKGTLDLLSRAWNKAKSIVERRI